MILSFALWLLIPFVPFIGLPGLAVAGVVVGLLVAAEVVFWVGVLLAGRDTWDLARRHGWRKVPGALWRMLRHPERMITRPAGNDPTGGGC